MKIGVKNRDDVERGLPLAENYAMISISCPNDRAKVKRTAFCQEILWLEFDDIDRPVVLLGGQKCKLFSEVEAEQILAFYKRVSKAYEYLIVHCDAGFSRSPAVAAALTVMQGHSDESFFKTYMPNRRVYSLLLSKFYNAEPVEWSA